jgi:hypothetical protein
MLSIKLEEINGVLDYRLENIKRYLFTLEDQGQSDYNEKFDRYLKEISFLFFYILGEKETQWIIKKILGYRDNYKNNIDKNEIIRIVDSLNNSIRSAIPDDSELKNPKNIMLNNKRNNPIIRIKKISILEKTAIN